MSAVGFIHDDLHPVPVRELHDAAKIRADAVIRRVIDEDRFCIGVFTDRRLYVAKLHAQSDTEFFVCARIDIDRHGAAEDHRVDDASVHIPRDDDLIPAGGDSKDHGLYGRGGTAHHEECRFRAKCLRRKLFRLFDDGDRVAEIVQWLHGIDVERHGALAQKGGQLGIPAAVLMSRHVKRNDPLRRVGLQCFRDRRAVLIFQKITIQDHSSSSGDSNTLAPEKISIISLRRLLVISSLVFGAIS